MQMIGYRKWIPGLGFDTADILLKLFETRLDFPSGSVRQLSVLRSNSGRYKKTPPIVFCEKTRQL